MLIISDSDEEVLLRTRRMLYAAGIMTITLPYTELLTVKFDETVYGLILEDPYDSHLPESFVYTFRRRNPNIPVIMFKQPFKDDCNSLWNADALIDSSLPSGKLVDELLLTLSKYHHRDVALFQLGTARDHLLDDAPTFNSITIHMTPIERNIFRHLIVAAYHPVSAKELQRYCTKPGTSPTIVCGFFFWRLPCLHFSSVSYIFLPLSFSASRPGRTFRHRSGARKKTSCFEE